MERVVFRLKLKPEMIDRYVEKHRAVWPRMLEALNSSGWQNYSLFLDRADGSLIGYLETESFEKAVSAMADTEVNAIWQAEMAEHFEDLAGGTPDAGFRTLEEVFNLEDQLRQRND